MIFFTKLAIGLNDSKTFAYRDYLNEILYPSIFNWKYFSFWLRSYIVVFEERTYLKEANLVHVQTKAEAEKIEKIFPGYSDRVIVAPNGIRTELLSCSYKGIDSNYILFMTHHTGGRYRESEWFIKKIWPEIIKKLPHARLLIVGKPSNKKIEYLENAESVIINGFAENLCEVYDKVRLVVLPVFHGTGLINRIQDALVAGTPIISTPQAISTFPEIRENEQIVAAATTTQFIQKVVWLYNNKEKRISLSKASRTFAETMCTWDATVQKIESALKENL